MSSNKQQLDAINSNARCILCLAGAGAGKSHSLVNRIARLVNDGVDPNTILALTFTNAAAFEMGQKYRNLPNVNLAKAVPQFRTFHSFCYSLIIKDKDIREKLGYSKVPSICDDKQMTEIKKEVKELTHCSLSDAKLFSPTAKLTPQEKFEKDVYKKAVKNRIRQENVITFDMLCYNVCKLFYQNDPLTEKYKQRYKVILVDEFQDTDPKQYRFIASFPASTSVFLVGDALQSIYQFRGTSNEFIKKLATDPNWTIIKLYENYRSTRQICEFANRFSAKYAKSEYRIEMNGQRDGDEVEVIHGSHTSMDEYVCRDHLAMLADRLQKSSAESAVLCRSNKEVDAVCRYLDKKQIVYVRSNKSSEAIDVLNSVLSDEYMLSWLSNSFLDATHYGDFIRLASLQEEVTLPWFLATYSKIPKISQASKKVFDIRRIVADESLDTVEKFNQITKLLRIKSICKLDLSEEHTDLELLQSIKDRMEELQEARIYVGTIHSSKGLEYDHVYLMGVNDFMFQLGTEEMNNLYYVGITRAKNHLTIFRK